MHVTAGYRTFGAIQIVRVASYARIWNFSRTIDTTTNAKRL